MIVLNECFCVCIMKPLLMSESVQIVIHITHRLVGDDEFYHVAHRHVLCKEFSLAGQGWLVADLRCWENNRTT